MAEINETVLKEAGNMSAVVNALPGVPDVESPLFENLFKSKNIPHETLQVARNLREDGFAVIDFPEPDLEHLSETIIRTLDPKYDWDAWRKGEVADLRVQDAWETVSEVKQIACNPKIVKLLSDLYGRRAFPFQTLNFPVGTQQHFHTDSVHFSCCPERFMVGVWVALEDIDEDNGPLIYYPGSHKLPIFTNEHIGMNPYSEGPNPYSNYPLYKKAWEAIVDALQLQPLCFRAKKGQALIWSANLLHGGAAQRDMNRTRYSQVTHYYFERCCYYTPIESVPFLGRIHYREIRDITTGEPVANKVNGVEVPKAQPAPSSLGQHFRRWLDPLKPSRTESNPQRVPMPPGFDPDAYLKANPDVAVSGIDPAKHWVEFGQHEGRPLR